MFDRLLRFAELRRALEHGHYELALRLAEDPGIRADRRAAELRRRTLAGLCERARRRADSGMLDAALEDLGRVLAIDPEFHGARTLQRDLEDRRTAQCSNRQQAGELRRLARQQADAGDLSAALGSEERAGILAADPVARASLLALVDGRRAAARAGAVAARTALHERRWREAIDACLRARAADPRCEELAALEPELQAKLPVLIGPEVEALLAAGNLEQGAAALSAAIADVPGLREAPAIQALVAKQNDAVDQRLRAAWEAGDLVAAEQVLLTIDRRFAGADRAATLERVLQHLRDHGASLARGDLAGAAEALSSLGLCIGAHELQRKAADLQAAAEAVERKLAQARDLAQAGNLVGARGCLLEVLERWPTHEAARSELQAMDLGAQERERALAGARAAARAGRLREAYATALACAVPGHAGEEARLLLKDVQSRLDFVGAGIDQVRRALHGRDSSQRDGLEHCRARLEQLTKVQTDHEELAPLLAALQAEIEGLAVLGELRAAIGAGQRAAVQQRFLAFAAVQGRLLGPQRLESRLLEAVDAALHKVREESDATRATAAIEWLASLAPIAAGRPPVAARIGALRQDIESRLQRADELARAGHEALAARDVATAESKLDAARRLASDGAAARSLEEELLAVRRQENALAEVAGLTAAKDFAAAHRRLGSLPPTPPFLRTRIFDIKQSLARAQGLDQGFLLRVDEGGEYLVLRGDSITIGNVRDGGADLVILANIAGRHARILRSLSFHGGLQDKIVAERGPLSVGGVEQREHSFVHGDRVRLGTSLELVYELPSKRSLTARLLIRGGFRAAGTDKVLLLKDRGRDGRILLGGAEDAHVRVSGASGEVEVFAHRDGQVRVRIDGRGEMDGKPFQGEHPATPGAWIRCAGLAFTLLPLARA
jgi:hypothetical protein